MFIQKLLTGFVAVCFSAISFAAGIGFHHGDLNSALDKARQENKKVFIDFYTDWCGPCKVMDQVVFPRDEVGEYFNPRFVALKIDAESEEGEPLAEKYDVHAYPTLVVLNPDGTVFDTTVGAFPTAFSFVNYGKELMGEQEDFEAMYARYMDGEKNLDSVQALLLRGISFLQSVNDEDRQQWSSRISEIKDWYFVNKPLSSLINKDDFQIISTLIVGPTNSEPVVKFVYDHYQEFRNIVNPVDLAIFVVSNNGLSIQDTSRTGDETFRDYVAQIAGSLAPAYNDYLEHEGKGQDLATLQQKLRITSEFNYSLFEKDIDQSLYWARKSAALNKSDDPRENFRAYMSPVRQISTQVMPFIDAEGAEKVVKFIEEAIEAVPGAAFYPMKADFLLIAGKTTEAAKLYEKTLEESSKMDPRMAGAYRKHAEAGLAKLKQAKTDK